MRLLVATLAALAALAGSAAADPTVAASRSDCTTEPSPVQPELRARRAPRGLARIHIVGGGNVCDASWAATPSGRGLELATTDGGDVISACGTCAVTVTIRGLARGRHVVYFDDQRVTVRVR
jgi:hypothetical protein